MTDRTDYGTQDTSFTGGGGSERTVTAMYDTRGAAETARDGLVSLGISSSSISIRGSEGGGSTSGTSSTTEDRGFWAELKDLFVPDEDRATYAEGLSRGGYLLTARVPEGMVDEALDVLERSEPVDIDERSESWRQSGWTGQSDVTGAGMTGAGMAAGTGMAGTTTTGYTDTTTTTTTTERGSGARDTGLGLGAARTRDDGVVERAEEQLRVGKRETGRGTVRVRSYVVETPVEEQVTLRDERVEVERRPVDRAVRAGDGVFEERVIEATERSEEAVVSKEARVVEEIGLRKEGGERTETVRDTVRRQEVDIEDDRTARGGVTGSTRVEVEDDRAGGLTDGTSGTTRRNKI